MVLSVPLIFPEFQTRSWLSWAHVAQTTADLGDNISAMWYVKPWDDNDHKSGCVVDEMIRLGRELTRIKAEQRKRIIEEYIDLWE